jgi:hypothetical protein
MKGIRDGTPDRDLSKDRKDAMGEVKVVQCGRGRG